MKAPARFVSTVNRFGFGRSRVGRAATPSVSLDAKGSGARSSRHPLALIATLLASAALLFAVLAPGALAAPAAQPSFGYFANFGSGQIGGQFEADPLFNPIVLDSHANLLVANAFGGSSERGGADVFAPDPIAGGTFLANVTLAPNTSLMASLPEDLAIDVTDDALYVQPSASRYNSAQYKELYELEGIKRFVSDGEPTPSYTVDPGFTVEPGQGIAVDPTTHDLLVSRAGAEAISRYDTTGALVSTIATPGIKPSGIAVAADGAIYISGSGKITKISGSGALLGEIATEGIPAVNQVSGVLVVAVGNRLKSYSPTGTFLSEGVMPVSPAGIVVDDARERIYAYNRDDRSVYVFVPAIDPGIEAPVVSEITPTGVHVSAEVDPGEEQGGGLPAGSELCFEFKPAAAETWNLGPCQKLSGPETPEAEITELEPNLDYVVRAKASNSLLSHTSAAVPFHTLSAAPEAETNDATDIGETAAVLNGTINPVGTVTTFHFEYGTTKSYGSRAPALIEAVAGSERVDRRFGRTITGLEPATTYHFRLVAENVAGTIEGADRTFTTAVAGAVLHRAYEQVTPVDKGGIPIREGFAFQAKADGSAISYGTQASSSSAPCTSRSMSLRGGADWTGGIDLDPPLNRIGGIICYTTLAVSADFTHTLIATNRKLTPDAVEDGPDRLNLYVVDLGTGTHTLVGTAPSGLVTFISAQFANKFFAASTDFSWIVFMSVPSLKPGAPENALYRWSTSGGLEVVSVLPTGAMAGVAVGNDKASPVRSVSADGSRVYFTVVGGGLEEGVFLRKNADQPQSQLVAGVCTEPAKACTAPISVSHISGDPGAPHRAVLVGASEDGRYAFFFSTDGVKLTSDAPDVAENAGNMYRYDTSNDSLEYLGAPARVGGSFASEDSAVPIAVGKDGQTAYWIARIGFETPTLVWRDGLVKTAAPVRVDEERNASPSPDGRYMAYNIGDVYLYDGETDQRSCVSCLPDGSTGGGRLRDSERYVSNRLEQAVTDSGQVFFTSPARLVAADVNGALDVYEYKDGKNTLVSPGNAPFDAIFADISEDGSDVFFTTPQKLVGQDNDQTADLYDARVGGGLAKQNPPPPQECLRDDCKATPGAGPELPFGGSEALSGPGNVAGEARKRCAKGTHARKVKGKTRCVKQSKAKKKAKNTKRANTNRRQGR